MIYMLFLNNKESPEPGMEACIMSTSIYEEASELFEETKPYDGLEMYQINKYGRYKLLRRKHAVLETDYHNIRQYIDGKLGNEG